MEAPMNGWFLLENRIKIEDDWGYPYFGKTPYKFQSLKPDITHI